MIPLKVIKASNQNESYQQVIDHNNLHLDPRRIRKKGKTTGKLMERKANNGGGNNKTTYEDFEPNFKWKTEADQDTLELQVEGFKMEHLKVQVNSLGKILVSGERSLDDKKLKRIRFNKEFDLKKEHNSNGVRAKFGRGILHIIVPKFKENTTNPNQTPPKMSQGTLPDKKSSESTADAKNDQNVLDRNSYTLLRRQFGVVDRRRALWFTAMVVGITAVGITTYLSYKYWFLAGEGIGGSVPEVFAPP